MESSRLAVRSGYRGWVLWQYEVVVFDWSNKKVYVAGHNGLVGSALVRALERAGAGEVISWRSSELDLRDRDATFTALAEAKPDCIPRKLLDTSRINALGLYPTIKLRDGFTSTHQWYRSTITA